MGRPLQEGILLLGSGQQRSSEAEAVYSACAGLGTESPAPGKDTLDRRLFLTPLQLFGILKAHRLW